jgi:hypothetical protein
MPSDFLDKYEQQYLRSFQWPPLAWLRTVFWAFLPAMGIAAFVTQWLRGIDVIGMWLTAGIFALLSLVYFPLVQLTAKPISWRVINWSGIVRRVPAGKGNVAEDYIGDRRVFLPMGWDEYFAALVGREVHAHGVYASDSTIGPAPMMQLLSLNRAYSISREMQAGFTRLDLSQLYFGLALVPIGVLAVLAIKIRFQLIYLVVFGAVSLGFALYGLYVTSRNTRIHEAIAKAYREGRDPNLLYVQSGR